MSGSTVNPFRWVGQLGYYYDTGSGTFYIRSRYYNPGLARFVSRDTLGFPAGTLDPYRYAGGQPTRYVDPSGQITAEIGTYWRIRHVDRDARLGNNALILQMMAFSDDGCNIVSGQMLVRAFRRWPYHMDVTTSGPRITRRNSDACECGKLECVQGEAKGNWHTRRGIPFTGIGFNYYLTTVLELEVCADGTVFSKKTNTVKTTFGWNEKDFTPTGADNNTWPEIADWTSGEVYLEDMDVPL